MNKKFLIAWVAIFVQWMLGSFLVHGTLLRADYDTLVKLGVFRAPAEAEKLFPVMILAHIITAGAFVWIYERGVETAKPWLAQGLRFGIAVALLGVIAGYRFATWCCRCTARQPSSKSCSTAYWF
jgi:hypothetical protein